MLGVPSALTPTAPLDQLQLQSDEVERQAVREQLRAELARRGLSGLAVRRPALVYGAAGVLLLLLLLPVVSTWLAPDLAEGKVWTASSAWGPFPVTGVMLGDAPLDGRFHTNDEISPWVIVDLGRVYDVHAVQVENRVNCCRERAVPMRVELSVDKQRFWRVAYRRAIFERFTAHFATRKARYVRLTVDRRSTLHLRRVAVY